MSARRDFPSEKGQVHPIISYLPSLPVLSAVAAVALGAGIFVGLPNSNSPEQNNEAPATTGSAAASTSEDAPDDSLCNKQAWPYVDQRCAQRVEAARGTRQVRIVTDKGTSVTAVMPQPIVEAKPKPAPQAPKPTPVVAQQTDRQIGPPVAPMSADKPQQPEQVAVAPQAAPAPQNSQPQPAPAPAVQTAAAPANPPAAASAAPVAAGVDAFADAPQKKSKSARAAEKAQERKAKREAKRKAIEQDSGDVPEDVAAMVRSQPPGQNSRRASRGAVPDDVIDAVERAAAREDGGRGRRAVVQDDAPVYVIRPGGGW